MSVTINAKGTSVTSFKIGRNGPTITEDSTITAGPPSVTNPVNPNGNLTLTANGVNAKILFTGDVGPGIISATASQNLYIDPTLGGGGNLILIDNQWPLTDGTSGQFLKTNGAGILSWGSQIAPNYQEFSATASQTIFNTTVNTVAKASGKSYLQVFVNGIFQQEGATKQYTVTGANQVTFNVG